MWFTEIYSQLANIRVNSHFAVQFLQARMDKESIGWLLKCDMN